MGVQAGAFAMAYPLCQRGVVRTNLSRDGLAGFEPELEGAVTEPGDLHKLAGSILSASSPGFVALPYGFVDNLPLPLPLLGGDFQRRVAFTKTGLAGSLEISVIDRGSGIEPAQMENIFNPFFTTKPDGVGLGLAIVQKIVDGHGGRMAVESEPGKGSVFRVFLPVQREAPAPPQPLDTSAASRAPHGNFHRPRETYPKANDSSSATKNIGLPPEEMAAA